jgi:hypothetical protein
MPKLVETIPVPKPVVDPKKSAELAAASFKAKLD